MARDYNLSNEEKKQVEAKEKSIREKLRLDKHHKIERFGVTMSVLFVSLLCLTIAVCVKRYNDNKVQLGDTPIYTTSFEMSLTHNEGSVIDIYRNKAGTKTAILLKFDDMSSMKTDASNYQIWVTGYDSYYNDKVTGGVYVYGRSGYMALCFYSPAGFSNQICDIILRSNENIAQSQVSSSTPKDDSSFTDYDQARIYANLGANKMTEGLFLDTEDGSLLDSKRMYDEVVLLPQINSTKEELNQTLSNMEISLRQMDEYEADLKRMGMIVPERDASFKNDTITAYTGESVDITSSSNVIVNENASDSDSTASTSDSTSTETSSQTDTATNSDAGSDVNTDLLQLHTDYVFAGGFNFDWQSYDILSDKRLYTDICGETPLYQYLNGLETIIKSDTYELKLPSKWVRTDGSEFDSSNQFLQENDEDIKSDIELLTGAYNSYYTSKVNYQRKLLKKLLEYEYDESNFASNVSINASEDCCQVWHKYTK